MDKAQRAELLRQRFRAVGGFAYVTSEKTRKPVHESKPWRNMAWPEIIPDTKRAPTWMRQPDAKPDLTPRVKHNAGTSAVSKIAAKAAPQKLLRAFVNADQLLAARARR